MYKTQIASFIPHFTFTPVSIDAEKTTQNINTFGIKGPIAPKMWNKFTIHRIIGLMNLDESCST